MITAGQVIAIVIATLGAAAWLLAMTMPDLQAWFKDWRIRLTVCIVGFLLVVGGMWAVPYYAHTPKTMVETGKEHVIKGRDTAYDAWRRTSDWFKDWRWRSSDKPESDSDKHKKK